MFIDPSKFLSKFETLVSNSSKVRIVSAWVTENRLLDVLENRRKIGSFSVESIAGTSSNLSHPSALNRLRKMGKLKLGDEVSGRGIFHPKLYVFYEGDSATIWIGSPNFTNGGFPQKARDGNYEVIFETKFVRHIMECDKWFLDLWDGLKLADAKTIREYRMRWERNPATREANRAAGIPLRKKTPNLNLINRLHLRRVHRTMTQNSGYRVRFGITGYFGKSERNATPHFQIQLRENDNEIAFKGRRRQSDLFKSYNLSEYYDIEDIEGVLGLK